MPITKATASSIAPAAKGDLVVGSATNDASVLAVGSANQVLTVDSSTSTGLKWAAPAGGGKVLQVVSAAITTQTDINSATMTDTGITATITPTLSSSKVLVMIQVHCRTQESAGPPTDIYAGAQLLRGATQIVDFDNGNGFFQRIGGAAGTLRLEIQSSILYLDSPATTSATTYKLQARAISPLTAVQFQMDSVPSNIVLMEIGA